MGFFSDADWNGNWILIPSSNRRCGSINWPPNGEKENDWSNTKYFDSDCMDWNPDGNITETPINCTMWNCNRKDYFIFWMQNLPGTDNNLTYNGSRLRNWWDFIGNFNDAMKEKADLVY